LLAAASEGWCGMNFHGSDDAAVAGWLAEAWSETATESVLV
jgi:hypothetical protein